MSFIAQIKEITSNYILKNLHYFSAYFQAKKRIAAIIKRILQKKRNNIKGRIPRDAIDVLISDNNDKLTDELISDNMVDFMIPAEDSVPVLITLVIKYLSECPHALHQLEVNFVYS